MSTASPHSHGFCYTGDKKVIKYTVYNYTRYNLVILGTSYVHIYMVMDTFTLQVIKITAYINSTMVISNQKTNYNSVSVHTY